MMFQFVNSIQKGQSIIIKTKKRHITQQNNYLTKPFCHFTKTNEEECFIFQISPISESFIQAHVQLLYCIAV
uniref:Uncharacterized protein n=1 Tax=Anguilla anguilla TaxID=7936 RepID=A0A0E9XAS9_ANGAN